MRKKAERQIRQAAANLGVSDCYPIDRVRAGAGLVRKVYDKTILDMARLETIELIAADPVHHEDVSNLIVHQGIAYAFFRFLENEAPLADTTADVVDIAICGIEREQWQRFEYYCKNRENKDPSQKIEEMIRAYNRGEAQEPAKS